MARPSQSDEHEAGTERKTAHFAVNAALLEELGERLVSKPEIALAELVKNAYDADASECTLFLTGTEITVRDDGHGMTESEFLKNWMIVSSQEKARRRFSRKFQRNMAGSKGVGRFSARFLGNVVELTTFAKDQTGQVTKLHTTFDWKKIAAQKTIDDIEIPYTIEYLDRKTPSGTTLRISELRDSAQVVAVSKVKTDILRLTDPAAGLELPPFKFEARKSSAVEADPGFSVKFAEHATSAPTPHSVSESIATQILDSYLGRVRLEIVDSSNLKYQVFWRNRKAPLEQKQISLKRLLDAYSPEKLRPKRDVPADPRGLAKEVEDVQHIPLANALNSPAFIDIRFFPKRKGTFAGLPVNGTKAQAWVAEHASVAIVDNNFVMPAYADRASDWLGIDASKALNQRSWQSVITPAIYPMDPAEKADPARNPMLALPRGSQLIGRVHIATSKRAPELLDDGDDWLQPNMDRESLRANGAYRLLWHISRFAVELLAHFDRRIRLEEEEESKKEAEREARTALSAAINEVRKSEHIEPEFRQRVVAQLKIAQTRISEAAEYEKDARTSLELMSLMGVMAGFMTHEFEKAMGALEEAADLIKEISTLSPPLKKNAEELLAHEKSLAHYLDYMRFFVKRSREPRPQQFKAQAQVSLVVKTLSSIADAHSIHTAIAIDPKLDGPLIPVAAYNGIVINLVSNALKAIVPRIGGGERQIKITATNDGGRHVLVCADNGIGIPDYLRTRIWDPLFTTTTSDDANPLGSGLGLGLTIVQRVVSQLGGRIELLDEAPSGFVTAFRVSLPLDAT